MYMGGSQNKVYEPPWVNETTKGSMIISGNSEDYTFYNQKVFYRIIVLAHLNSQPKGMASIKQVNQ